MSLVKKNKENSKTNLQKNERENIDPQWNVENHQLQTDSKANNRLRQQIEKQSYADTAVQVKIKDKISDLKQKAIQQAQNLQSQKRKNIELQAIIRHMTVMRVEEKSVQVSHRDDNNFDSVDNLARKIKKFQYDLEQMFAKLNDLTSKTKQKKSEVDAYRTQRVIDSGIFLKIQKEIIQSETQYKKLLIQKTIFEQQYYKSLQNYKKLKADIQKEQYVSVSKRQIRQKQQNQEQFYMNMPEIQHALKFTEINHSQARKKSFIGSKKILNSYLDIKKQQHHQDVEYAVKKIFIQTGINSAETLIDYLLNIENINDNLFKQVNKDTDRISQLMKQINNLKIAKEKKTIKYYQHEPQMTKNEIKSKQILSISEQIQKIQANCTKSLSLLHSFLKNKEIKHATQLFDVNLKSQTSIQDLQEIFSSLQIKINPAITHYNQFKKDIQREENFQQSKPCQQKQQSIQQLINRVKRMEQSEKLMMRQDFKKQYEKLIKSQNNKMRQTKKKPTMIRKH